MSMEGRRRAIIILAITLNLAFAFVLTPPALSQETVKNLEVLLLKDGPYDDVDVLKSIINYSEAVKNTGFKVAVVKIPQENNSPDGIVSFIKERGEKGAELFILVGNDLKIPLIPVGVYTSPPFLQQAPLHLNITSSILSYIFPPKYDQAGAPLSISSEREMVVKAFNKFARYHRGELVFQNMGVVAGFFGDYPLEDIYYEGEVSRFLFGPENTVRRELNETDAQAYLDLMPFYLSVKGHATSTGVQSGFRDFFWAHSLSNTKGGAVLVELEGCWTDGWFVKDANDLWGATQRFFSEAGIFGNDYVVTMVLGSPGRFASVLIEMYRMGKTLGEAVASTLSSTDLHRSYWVLFGDPLLKLPENVSPHPPEPRSLPIRPSVYFPTPATNVGVSKYIDVYHEGGWTGWKRIYPGDTINITEGDHIAGYYTVRNLADETYWYTLLEDASWDPHKNVLVPQGEFIYGWQFGLGSDRIWNSSYGYGKLSWIIPEPLSVGVHVLRSLMIYGPWRNESASMLSVNYVINVEPYRPRRPRESVELFNDDGNPSGASGGSFAGATAEFASPSQSWVVSSIKINGYLLAPRGVFQILLWDEDPNRPIFSSTYNASEFFTTPHDESDWVDWVEVEVPRIEVDGDFHVSVAAGERTPLMIRIARGRYGESGDHPMIRVTGYTRMGTSLALSLQPASVKIGDSVVITGTLIDDNGKPVAAGQSITFQVGTTLVGSAATDPSGNARIRYDINLDAGTYKVMASYEGSGDYQGSTAISNLVINLLRTTLAVSFPSTATQGKPVTLTATLKDERGNPIQGANVDFYVSATKIGTATTGPDGMASTSYTPQETGTFQLSAAFGGARNYAESSSVGAIEVQVDYTPYIAAVAVAVIAGAVGIALRARRIKVMLHHRA